MPLNPSSHYVRDVRAIATTTAGTFLLTKPGSDAQVFRGIEVDPVAWLWECLASPVPGSRLLEFGEGDVRQVLEVLVERGYVTSGSAEDLARPGQWRPTQSGEKPCRHLVLGATGTVQTTFIANYVVRLLTEFTQELDVVLTESAQKFVRPDALSKLGVDVWCDPFESRTDVSVPHVYLANQADLVLVLPTSAHTLFRLAHGACSDLLSLVTAATLAPVVLVPSMNSGMWSSPAVQRNVSLLRQDGRFVVEPGLGVQVSDGREAKVAVGAIGLDSHGMGLVSTLAAVLRDSRQRSSQRSSPQALSHGTKARQPSV